MNADGGGLWRRANQSLDCSVGLLQFLFLRRQQRMQGLPPPQSTRGYINRKQRGCNDNGTFDLRRVPASSAQDTTSMGGEGDTLGSLLSGNARNRICFAQPAVPRTARARAREPLISFVSAEECDRENAPLACMAAWHWDGTRESHDRVLWCFMTRTRTDGGACVPREGGQAKFLNLDISGACTY